MTKKVFKRMSVQYLFISTFITKFDYFVRCFCDFFSSHLSRIAVWNMLYIFTYLRQPVQPWPQVGGHLLYADPVEEPQTVTVSVQQLHLKLKINRWHS